MQNLDIYVSKKWWILIVLSVLLSCVEKDSNKSIVCDFYLPIDSSLIQYNNASDFVLGSLIYNQDTAVFYCGSRPDLMTELKSLIRDYPQLAIEFEQTSPSDQFYFFKTITEQTPEQQLLYERLNKEHAKFTDFPSPVWDTINLYHGNFGSHTIWAAISIKTGPCEVVIHDSTLSYLSQNYGNNDRLQYSTLVFYFENKSIKDTAQLFDLLEGIEKKRHTTVAINNAGCSL